MAEGSRKSRGKVHGFYAGPWDVPFLVLGASQLLGGGAPGGRVLWQAVGGPVVGSFYRVSVKW